MLKRFHVNGFKSIDELEITLPQLTVLVGPNAAGKSNLLEAIHMLSLLGTERTLAEAFEKIARGHAMETFAFPPGGLPEMLNQRAKTFLLEADLVSEKPGQSEALRYRVGVRIEPASGRLSVIDEYLTKLKLDGTCKGTAVIEPRSDGHLAVRRKSKGNHPRWENLGKNHTILSDAHFSGEGYELIDTCRDELVNWDVHYLDPRHAMRLPVPPMEVLNIGINGETLAPFLYRLQAEDAKTFAAVERTLRTLVPSIDSLRVDLDKNRGHLDIYIKEGGTEYSSRLVSEGTLRVLALVAIAVNPWSGRLVAFEEPENGVHPRRLELIARLLVSMTSNPARRRQVIVTTHSPLFCDAILRLGKEHPELIGLFVLSRAGHHTRISPFRAAETLFQDAELRRSLSEPDEDSLFEKLSLRGYLDA